MSLGWSPTGTFVNPGKSTNVRSKTFFENILIIIGYLEIPLFFPAIRYVYLYIYFFINEKSVNYTYYLPIKIAYYFYY